MKTKRIPERICIGCQQVKPKNELIRIVKSPEGEISIDKTGKKSGRGAYICPKEECLKLAEKSRRIEKSFSCRIDAAVYEELENELKNN
ncbi:MAG: YlxR family protein [Oscillospiraceae bacterium]|nr:YlxR family protein [Oscillospiraceae bacterium]MDD6084554.1 YlxR family protein [Oscillospiraceae bacterium]MDY3258235.1 YlxR family protein [Ruminococcus callidus]